MIYTFYAAPVEGQMVSVYVFDKVMEQGKRAWYYRPTKVATCDVGTAGQLLRLGMGMEWVVRRCYAVRQRLLARKIPVVLKVPRRRRMMLMRRTKGLTIPRMRMRKPS